MQLTHTNHFWLLTTPLATPLATPLEIFDYPFKNPRSAPVLHCCLALLFTILCCCSYNARVYFTRIESVLPGYQNVPCPCLRPLVYSPTYLAKFRKRYVPLPCLFPFSYRPSYVSPLGNVAFPTPCRSSLLLRPPSYS